MTAPVHAADPGRPRWDGSRVLFEIAVGTGSVPCAISRAALEDIARRRHLKPAELLACFASARERIEATAHNKLRGRAGLHVGTLAVWADDVEDLPSPNSATPASDG